MLENPPPHFFWGGGRLSNSIAISAFRKIVYIVSHANFSSFNFKLSISIKSNSVPFPLSPYKISFVLPDKVA